MFMFCRSFRSSCVSQKYGVFLKGIVENICMDYSIHSNTFLLAYWTNVHQYDIQSWFNYLSVKLEYFSVHVFSTRNQKRKDIWECPKLKFFFLQFCFYSLPKLWLQFFYHFHYTTVDSVFILKQKDFCYITGLSVAMIL